MVNYTEVFNEVAALFHPDGYLIWLLTLGIAIVLTPVVSRSLWMISKQLEKWSARTPNVWDDFLVGCIGAIQSWVIFVVLFIGITKLWNTTGIAGNLIHGAMMVTMAVQIGAWGLAAMNVWRDNFLHKKISQDVSSAAATGLLFISLKILLLVTIVLTTLSNLGVDIAALLTGLGIGGIAIALAAQNVLGDLLASLSIVLDKPFVVGDFIKVGDNLGLVESIGLKTTRIRSISGEELIISNKDLLENRISNYKRMSERRIVQTMGVKYATSMAKLEAIPLWIKQIILTESKLRFDRCHLANCGAYAIEFELVFFVLDPEYNTFMDIQQNVLLAIFKKFNEEQVEFAFPTQTIHVHAET